MLRKTLFLFIALLSLTFSSCMSAKKYQSMVDFYADSSKVNYEEHPNVFVESDLKASRKNDVLKTKNLFVPLVLFWLTKTRFEVDLNNNFKSDLIKQGILERAKELDLKSLLDERKIEIRLNEIPGSYEFKKRKGFLVLFVYYGDFENNEINPGLRDLHGTYSIGEETLKEIYIQNNQNPYHALREETSIFNHDYFEQYKKEMNDLGKKLLNEILSDHSLN